MNVFQLNYFAWLFFLDGLSHEILGFNVTAAKEGDQNASFAQLSKLTNGAPMVEPVNAAPTQLQDDLASTSVSSKEDVFAPLFSLIPVLYVDHLPDCSRPEVRRWTKDLYFEL